MLKSRAKVRIVRRIVLSVLGVIVLPFLAIKFMKNREISHRNACINHLRQIEGAKDQHGLWGGITNGYKWKNDEQAFMTLVSTSVGYMKAYPLCPSSTTDTKNAAQAAADYDVNPIGINAVCAVDKTHVLQ